MAVCTTCLHGFQMRALCTSQLVHVACSNRSLLVYAISSEKLSAVKAVLDMPSCLADDSPIKRVSKSGFLRRCDSFGRSVFHYAAHHGDTEIFTFLMDQFEIASKWQEFAVNELHGRKLEPLPENSLPATSTKADVLCRESSDVGPTLLCQAALKGHVDMVKLLLKNGACDTFTPLPGQQSSSQTADGKPRQQDTALICAATGGHAEVVKAILASGTYDLAARGQFGEAAVHRAAACKHKDVLRILLDHGADADAIAEPPAGWTDAERNRLTLYWGGTALLRAAHVGDLERVNMLLARQAKACSSALSLNSACA
jgi:ankyrin repeat protein